MSRNLAISLENVSRFYKLYDSNRNRLKEILNPLGTKYHQEFYALKNINLEVNRGEILGILGSNGSGKSTLLKVITGIIVPQNGSVLVDGRISALLELGTGFNPEFTGRENIYFHGIVNDYGREFMDSRIDEIIAFADIGKYIDQPLKSYSSGMKTRLGFAVAIHVSPDILILDEVLAVGDELFRRKCYAKMEEFLNRGTTILYVSHDLNSVMQMCTRAVFMHEGQLLSSGDPKSICNLYQRVIYATPAKRMALIETLLETSESELQRDQDSLESAEKASDAACSSSQDGSPPDKEDAVYLEELNPAEGIEYRNEEVDIRNIEIRNMAGTRVNVLDFGESYIYSATYHSDSDSNFKDITFGFEIKNERGTILSSIDAQMARKKNIYVKELNRGDSVEVKVQFDCCLPAGTYFTNSGLSAFGTGEQVVLNRKIDSTCFKVRDSSSRVFSGMFSCMTRLSIGSRMGVQEYLLEERDLPNSDEATQR